ncbi:MAG: hypothetical protein H0W73_11440 [Bacteroidetes bacterium]|nr:hypothetical protein [Bacteroidota bacterium]
MKLKKVIVQLQYNIHAYEPFLVEWSKNENCSLSPEDLRVIDTYININFKINFLSLLRSFKQKKQIQTIVSKLIWDYQKFKEWVITNFVFRILKLIRNNSFNNFFLHLPLDYLSLSYELKNKLKLLKIKTVYDIFENYNEEDFYKTPTFNYIVAFEITLKRLSIK